MNDLSTMYPLISENWDYVKNSPLLPTQVMPKSHKTVWWTCKKCGYEYPKQYFSVVKYISFSFLS